MKADNLDFTTIDAGIMVKDNRLMLELNSRDMGEAIQKLFKSCLSRDYQMRPTFDNIVELLQQDPDLSSLVSLFKNKIYI